MEKSRAELAEIETALAQAAELMQEREKAIEEIKKQSFPVRGKADTVRAKAKG